MDGHHPHPAPDPAPCSQSGSGEVGEHSRSSMSTAASGSERKGCSPARLSWADGFEVERARESSAAEWERTRRSMASFAMAQGKELMRQVEEQRANREGSQSPSSSRRRELEEMMRLVDERCRSPCDYTLPTSDSDADLSPTRRTAAGLWSSDSDTEPPSQLRKAATAAAGVPREEQRGANAAPERLALQAREAERRSAAAEEQIRSLEEMLLPGAEKGGGDQGLILAKIRTIQKHLTHLKKYAEGKSLELKKMQQPCGTAPRAASCGTGGTPERIRRHAEDLENHRRRILQMSTAFSELVRQFRLEQSKRSEAEKKIQQLNSQLKRQMATLKRTEKQVEDLKRNSPGRRSESPVLAKQSPSASRRASPVPFASARRAPDADPTSKLHPARSITARRRPTTPNFCASQLAIETDIQGLEQSLFIDRPDRKQSVNMSSSELIAYSHGMEYIVSVEGDDRWGTRMILSSSKYPDSLQQELHCDENKLGSEKGSDGGLLMMEKIEAEINSLRNCLDRAQSERLEAEIKSFCIEARSSNDLHCSKHHPARECQHKADRSSEGCIRSGENVLKMIDQELESFQNFWQQKQLARAREEMSAEEPKMLDENGRIEGDGCANRVALIRSRQWQDAGENFSGVTVSFSGQKESRGGEAVKPTLKGWRTFSYNSRPEDLTSEGHRWSQAVTGDANRVENRMARKEPTPVAAAAKEICSLITTCDTDDPLLESSRTYRASRTDDTAEAILRGEAGQCMEESKAKGKEACFDEAGNLGNRNFSRGYLGLSSPHCDELESCGEDFIPNWLGDPPAQADDNGRRAVPARDKVQAGISVDESNATIVGSGASAIQTSVSASECGACPQIGASAAECNVETCTPQTETGTRGSEASGAPTKSVADGEASLAESGSPATETVTSAVQGDDPPVGAGACVAESSTAAPEIALVGGGGTFAADGRPKPSGAECTRCSAPGGGTVHPDPVPGGCLAADEPMCLVMPGAEDPVRPETGARESPRTWFSDCSRERLVTPFPSPGSSGACSEPGTKSRSVRRVASEARGPGAAPDSRDGYKKADPNLRGGSEPTLGRGRPAWAGCGGAGKRRGSRPASPSVEEVPSVWREARATPARASWEQAETRRLAGAEGLRSAGLNGGPGGCSTVSSWCAEAAGVRELVAGCSGEEDPRKGADADASSLMQDTECEHEARSLKRRLECQLLVSAIQLCVAAYAFLFCFRFFPAWNYPPPPT